jgi:hypothetical protein
VKITRLVTLAAMTVALAPAAHAAATKIVNCPKTITQPGLYELQDNLDSAGTCIIVQADFVTIDLGGFRIRGNRIGSAITDSGLRRGTTVRNGTVTNFENGIELGNASVDNVKSFGNDNVGIFVITGSVRNSHAEGNVNNHGISVGGRSLVAGNISVGNRTGISATHGSIVHGNTVADNTNHGILTLGTGMSIVNNAVFNNASMGIAVDCPSLVLANTALFHSTNLLLRGVGCKDDHNATQ